MSKMERLAVVLHLPHGLCVHLVGHHNSSTHRMVSGLAVMAVGVTVAKTSGLIETEWVAVTHALHITGDMLGYLIHAIGGIPFIEALLEE